MRILKNISFGYVLAVACVVFVTLSQSLEITLGQRLASELFALCSQMIILVPCIFTLIGLLDAWVPQDWIRTHIGEEAGVRSAFYIVLLAMFQRGPLDGAFPTAHLLWTKGVQHSECLPVSWGIFIPRDPDVTIRGQLPAMVICAGSSCNRSADICTHC